MKPYTNVCLPIPLVGTGEGLDMAGSIAPKSEIKKLLNGIKNDIIILLNVIARSFTDKTIIEIRNVDLRHLISFLNFLFSYLCIKKSSMQRIGEKLHLYE
ncbi:MAG: hypothetical protein LBD80_00405 [Tannerella sp.]|nr:hypothetical protein [Tannerella sp.]